MFAQLLTDNAKYIPAGFVDNEDSSGNFTPGDWRNAVAGDTRLLNIGKVGGNRYAFQPGLARDKFKQYFSSSQRQVSWQLKHVQNCGKIH